MKHINIPVFVPHVGCPNDCAFCNQRTITGHREFDISSVDREIESYLSGIQKGEADVEIAFFGGSFTGIERSLMITLLEKASSYIKSGDASSIRLSTRPDYINEEILSVLSSYPVKTVELGIQSMDDRVLAASMRGHTSDASRNAARLITEAGLDFVGQMMVGLPLSTQESEIETARFIADSGAVSARIYPVVVFKGTGLYDMMNKGIYTPLSPQEAAERASELLEIFYEKNVNLLRIGLCETDGLRDGDIAGGAYHPALGSLTLSAYYRKKILSAIGDADICRRSLTVYVKRGKLSLAIGHGGETRRLIQSTLKPSHIYFSETDSISEHDVKIEIKEEAPCD